MYFGKNYILINMWCIHKMGNMKRGGGRNFLFFKTDFYLKILIWNIDKNYSDSWLMNKISIYHPLNTDSLVETKKFAIFASHLHQKELCGNRGLQWKIIGQWFLFAFFNTFTLRYLLQHISFSWILSHFAREMFW